MARRSRNRRPRLDMTGVEDLLAEFERMGNSADSIIDDCLKAGAQPIYETMKENAHEFYYHGDVYRAIQIFPVQNRGTSKYIEIGVSSKDNPEAVHAFFQEFGTSEFPAQPFIAPAYERNKRICIEIMSEFIRGRMLG